MKRWPGTTSAIMVVVCLGVFGLLPVNAVGASVSVFTDAFETGNLSQWTSASGVAVQGSDVHGGTYAATASSTGTAAYARKTFSSTYSNLTYSTWFKVISKGANSVQLLRVQTGLGANIVSLFESTTNNLMLRNDVTAANVWSPTIITSGAWHELRLHVIVNGGSSQVEVFYDGTLVAPLSITLNLGTAPVGRLILGDNTNGRTYQMVFDDVSAAVPDTTPPAAPGNLQASAPSATSVDLTWNASTDNVGVTAYDVYRDGSFVNSVGAVTTYTDTTVSPDTPYVYEVRARDADGNVSDPSNQAPVTTPPAPDAEAPSIPGNVQASAPSATSIHLTWDASTDNVGVTAYDVYRDGSFVNSVGAVTTYTDTTVSPGTPYVYEVRARDADGNVSDPSNQAAVTTPVFVDGFETGDLSRWTSTAGVAVQGTDVHGGTYAATASITDGSAYASKTLSSTYSNLTYSTWFKVVSKGSPSVYLLRVQTAAGTDIVSLFDNSQENLALGNDTTGASVSSSTTITSGAWHELRLHVVVAGASSQVEVFYDGTLQAPLSITLNLGTAPVGRLILGDNTNGRTYQMVLDDVSALVPDTISPTAPGNLQASATSPTSVDLTWDASTDNVGVTAYDVYRDGSLVSSVGAVTTYTDTTVVSRYHLLVRGPGEGRRPQRVGPRRSCRRHDAAPARHRGSERPAGRGGDGGRPGGGGRELERLHRQRRRHRLRRLPRRLLPGQRGRSRHHLRRHHGLPRHHLLLRGPGARRRAQRVGPRRSCGRDDAGPRRRGGVHRRPVGPRDLCMGGGRGPRHRHARRNRRSHGLEHRDRRLRQEDLSWHLYRPDLLDVVQGPEQGRELRAAAEAPDRLGNQHRQPVRELLEQPDAQQRRGWSERVEPHDRHAGHLARGPHTSWWPVPPARCRSPTTAPRSPR